MLDDSTINALADRVATPFYCYHADHLRARFRSLKDALPDGTDVYYSLKANPNRAIIEILHAEGAGCEVSSPAELELALHAGVHPRRILLVGPGKSEALMERAVEVGIKAIVADSLEEVAALDRIAKVRGIVRPIAVRINPNFQTKGARITMTGRATQFGIDADRVDDVVAAFAGVKNVILVGLHVYLGSRILDARSVIENTRNILTLAAEVRARLGRQLAFVDVGGGFGVAYFDRESDMDTAELAAGLSAEIAAFRGKAPLTRVIIELGRWLVADAGTFVTRVEWIKQSRGKLFAICDGGSNVHAAAAGYGSVLRKNFPLRHVAKPDTRGQPQTCQPVTLTGPLCTPADVIGADVLLPPLKRGDLIVIERSGAYGASASPVGFLSFGAPAEVMVDGSAIRLVRMAEAPDHLIARSCNRSLDLRAFGTDTAVAEAAQ